MRENVLMKKSDIFWQTYLNLEKEVIEVSRYVFFTDEILVSSKGKLVTQSCNSLLEVFSPHISVLGPSIKRQPWTNNSNQYGPGNHNR